jgi:predicted 3-demethylubiquinone-9 3-methyltransferase (glyoxalase superfamily)
MAFVNTLIVAALVMVGVASAANQPQTPQPEKPSDSTGPGAGERGSKQDITPLPRVTTLLMFYGKAEEAMTLYTTVIPNSKITSVKRYGKGEAGAEGSVMHATFTLNGQEIMCIDSPPMHNFTFTPATSLFVACKTEEEINGLFTKLSKDGKVFMPLQAYPFAKKFAWCSDKFGVSWQLIWVQK